MSQPPERAAGLDGLTASLPDGIVPSMERMRAIEIGTATRVAVVEPDAFNAEVKAAAAAFGLWYPPDPSSFEICSIGGNVATNTGGLCSAEHGVTTDYVLGRDVVLADGTLGVVTRAILRLIPAQTPRSTLVATFATVKDAAAAVVAVGQTLRASMMELMDSVSINAIEDLDLWASTGPRVPS